MGIELIMTHFDLLDSGILKSQHQPEYGQDSERSMYVGQHLFHNLPVSKLER